MDQPVEIGLFEQDFARLFTAKAVAFEGCAAKLKLDFTGKPKVLEISAPTKRMKRRILKLLFCFSKSV